MKIFRRAFGSQMLSGIAALGAWRASATPPVGDSGFTLADRSMVYPGVWVPDYSNPECCPVPNEVAHGFFCGSMYLTGTRDGDREFATKNPTWKRLDLPRLIKATGGLERREFEDDTESHDGIEIVSVRKDPGRRPEWVAKCQHGNTFYSAEGYTERGARQQALRGMRIYLNKR